MSAEKRSTDEEADHLSKKIRRLETRECELPDSDHEVQPLAGGGAESKPSEEEEERGGSPLDPAGPFACSQCHGQYPTREQLERHETLHSLRKSCKICHESFANVYRLQSHMKSHDEFALLPKFKCNECDKAFKFNFQLKDHLRIIHLQKPYECSHCGEKFSHLESYSDHRDSEECHKPWDVAF